MGEFQEEKLRIMEDEMNRFEAEIAVPVPPHLARAVIGANTYNQVQRRLEEQQLPPEFHPGMFCPPMMNIVPSFPGIPPPPPPPPPLLIPHQLQHHRGGPPTLRPNLPMRPMEPMGPGNFDMHHPSMQQQHHQQQQQHHHQQHHQQPPQFVNSNAGPPPPSGGGGSSIGNTAVLSVAPLLYNPKPNVPKMKPSKVMKPAAAKPPVVAAAPPVVMDSYASFQNELSQLEAKKAKIDNKYESLQARDMAAKVKATTMMAAPVTSNATPPADEPQPTGQRGGKGGGGKKSKKLIRMAGGQTWEDNSLAEWEDDDYRIFCGDLGNDVTDEILTRTFNKYPSFLKAKVVRDKRSNKTKGFGFVSFKDPQDFIKAMKEMNGRYVGSRPIKLRKSSWKSRNLDSVRKKDKEKNALIGLLTGRQ